MSRKTGWARRRKVLPVWLAISLTVVLAAGALALSYVAWDRIDSGQHRGFPVTTGEPAETAEAGQPGMYRKALLSEAGSGVTDGRGTPWPETPELPGSAIPNDHEAIAAMELDVGLQSGSLYPANQTQSGKVEPNSCFARDPKHGSVRGVDDPFMPPVHPTLRWTTDDIATSIDGGSTWH